jgi:hypothetical protein
MFRVLRLLSLLLAAVLIVAPVAAGDGARSMLSTAGATASFSSFDGCGFTSVQAHAFERIDHMPPGDPVRTVEAFLNIFSFDFCTSSFAFLTGLSHDAAFFMDHGLNRATLDGAVRACGFPDCVDLTIAIAWEGVADSPTRLMTIHHSQFPTFSSYEHLRNVGRNATAVATISDGVKNLTPNPAQFATLGYADIGRTSPASQ